MSVSGPIVYDEAEWHYEAPDYPNDLAPHQAFVHTGMFLAWVVEHDLCGEELADMDEELVAVRDRTMTGADLFEVCDGVFADDMLDDEGNAFACAYFDFEVGPYWAAYEATLAAGLPSLYHVADTWENYDKLKPVINRRYDEWRKGR